VKERRGEVRPATSGYWDWALAHLLPFFADLPLTKIDAWAVDAYRLDKLEESDDRRRRLAEGRPRTDALGRPLRPLSPRSINKTIEVLRWLLSFAVEYGWIDDNPAVGKRRRIKIERSPPPHLESAGQIAAVLDAAAELDADPDWLIDDRLPVVSTLVFSGLRVHELAALHWGDLDFATSMIHIRYSKTPAGIREVRMLSALWGCLLRHRDRQGRPGSRELVFPTSRGGPRTKDNVRLRILRPVLARAEELLETRGQASLPPGITLHSLRHTFTSLLFAIGEDPVSVMRQLGHTDPAFTVSTWSRLRTYSRGIPSSGPSRTSVGRSRIVVVAEGLFAAWREFGADGDRRRLRRKIAPLEQEPRELCEAGRRKSTKTRYHRGLARNLIKVWPAPWSFVEHEGVEPTDNRAERGLRHAVIYRKLSQGSHSTQGAIATERLLSAVISCRLQGRSLFAYLTEVAQATIRGLPAPALA